MRIIAKKPIRQFWESFPDAEGPLKAWYADAKHADWKTPNDIKKHYASASIVANNLVVFNIGGNKYRLICHVRYDLGILFVRFVGTHEEYDKVDAASV